MNVGDQDGTIRFDLPDGAWRQVANRDEVRLEEGVHSRSSQMTGGHHELRVPGQSLLIWVRD